MPYAYMGEVEMATTLANVERVKRSLATGSPPRHFYVGLLGLKTYGSAELHDKV
jgi:hypothetical protein